MSNNSESQLIMVFLWLLTIGLSLGSGILAWNWVEPDGFITAVLFLAVWGLFSKICHFLVFGIVMAILD